MRKRRSCVGALECENGIRVLLAFVISSALGATELRARELIVDAASIHACFANTARNAVQPACVGEAANACQTLEHGSSRVGIINCVEMELEVWDIIAMEELQSICTHFGENAQEFLLHLGLAQKAWIAYRDAECAMRYEHSLGGSIRPISAVACRLNLTARRAFDLRRLRPQWFLQRTVIRYIS